MDWFTKNLFNNMGEISGYNNSTTKPKPDFTQVNKLTVSRGGVFGVQTSFFLTILVILAVWVAISPERFETVKSVISLILNSQ